jgi:N-methylhydantoinase B
LLRDSVEIDEMRHPILVRAQYIVPDTEGPGRHRGAPSGFVEFGPYETELEAMYLSDGTITPPLGARGGGAGAKARQYRRNADGSLTELDLYGPVRLAANETLLSYSTGGGGFGPPIERDPSRVLHDVREGWITPERAKQVYGVVTADDAIDEEATASRRAVMRADSASL